MVLLLLFIGGVNYRLIKKDFEDINSQNKINFSQLDKRSAFLSLKSAVDNLIIDIDATTTHVLTNIKDKELDITVQELKGPWRDKINPQIKKLDARLAKYSDEIKSDYFKISDIIDRIKRTQESFLKNDTSKLGYRSNFAQNVSELHILTTELNEASKEFLESFLGAPTRGFSAKIPDEGYILNFLISLLIVVLVLGLVLFVSANQLKRPIAKLEDALINLNKGELIDVVGIRNKDYMSLGGYLSSVNTLLKKVVDYAEEVSKGNYDNSVIFEKEGRIGSAMNEMKYSLSDVAKADAQRSHINEGLAKFSEILGENTNNLERFGDDVLKNLVDFLNANQGALFVIGDHDKSYLEISSCYAYEKKKYTKQKIKRGEGLVGQCWQEEKTVYMTRVPADYIRITSGLGYSTPRCVLIVPLKFNEEVQGVIELASFKPFEDYELNFVEKVAQSIASALASVKINTQTQFLLSQSETLTKKMKVQEEAMVKTVDELKMTQEESQRREEEHLREISRLRKRLEEYERNF